MKERALRRHQDQTAKKRHLKDYNSCIGELASGGNARPGGSLEKLKKECVMTHLDKRARKELGKSFQEKKHDISMAEQLRSN